MALTEEERKKKLKAKPRSIKEIKQIQSGARYTPPSKALQTAQADQPSAGDVIGGATDVLKEVARKPIESLAIPTKIGVDAVKSIGTGIKGVSEDQQQRLKTVGKYGVGSTKTLDTGEQVSEPSKLPTGAISTLPEPIGSTVDPATQAVSGEPSASDTGRDEGGRRTLTPMTTKATGARPSDTQQIAGYDVQGMSPEEAERFGAPVARPATRAERGLTPVGPNNSGQGYGARPRDEEREIAPPRSIGDQIRYKREIRERDKNRELATKQERTDIAGQRLAGDQEQQAFERDVSQQDRQKLQSLQQEFADPKTTAQRKRDIEREVGVMSGRPVSAEKSVTMTDKQKADTFRDIEKSESYIKWKKGRKHTFSEDEPSSVEDFINAERPDLKYLTSGDDEAMTKESYDSLKSGDTYIGKDGRTYRKQ